MSDSDNIVKDAAGQPVIPYGTEKPLSEAPKDTLGRPTPQIKMPAVGPETIQETVQNKAVESTTTFDELVAKKGFKSPEDLAKAYKELESQNKRVEVTLADAIKARQQPEVPLPAEADDTETALRIVDGRISKQVNAIKDAYDFKFHLIENPSDRVFAVDAIKYVRDNPGISWELAFKAAKADNSPQVASLAKEEGKNEAYQNIQNKEGGQTVQGGGQREPEVGVKDLIESIKTGRIPLSEAKQLINRISK